jgi:hypothetical protein
MGTFDISRINFDPKKHYSSVRMQQGRVLTDDDWNENERIENEDRRRSRVDIIGPFGSPDDGFKITKIPGLTGVIDAGRINFLINAGTLYLGGLRLELDEDETYRLQKDWLQQPFDLDKIPAFTGTEQFDLVYIETWQQPVSAVEDDSLFEVALGGPDTTTRLRTMRRVHLASNIGFCDCADAWQQLLSNWEAAHLGKINKSFERIRDVKLKVTFSDAGLPEDLCTPTAAGGYLGAENQAIRVQIVDQTHFTWGFDNASPLYRVTVSADGKTVHMLTEPKDQYHWPLSNQVVEILPWSAVLPNGEKVAEQMGHLSKVDASFNPDTGDFTLANTLSATFGIDWKSRSDKNDLDNQTPSEYFYLRVWHRGDDLASDPKIKFTPGTPVSLGHTGLEITITGSDIVAPDYWVIAARPETPNRIVPWELEQGIPPHGVRRFFAPLAIIRWSHIGRQISGDVMHDCRKKFNPLTEQECCCTYTVGDGIRSRGDYNSIEEAINNLPGNGGKICVLPGEHVANVTIAERRQIRISGCGDQSIVRPGPNQLNTPIFLIQNSQKIQIDQLTLAALDGIAIEVRDIPDSKMVSEKITINENRILAGIHAIKIYTKEDVGGDNSIDILYNQIGMIDKPVGKPAIFSIADDVLIERNRIVVVPAPDKEDPDDPRDPDDPGDRDPFDPCADPRLSYNRGFTLKYQLYVLFRYVMLYKAFGRFKKGYDAMGGIQIGGTSERVRIKENEIIGGRGNGITLGHLPEANNPTFSKSFVYNNVNFNYSALYEIFIDENQIFQMGLSGISALLHGGEKQHLVHVEDITIYRNIIRYCAHQTPSEIPKNLLNDWAFGGIVLSDCENGRIQENRIEENGKRAGEPICGVFILHGELIDISANNIIKNGTAITDNQIPVKPGARCGIVIKMSFKAADLKKFLAATVPSFDGVPAAKIHDNIVEQPLGHALFIIAFGPVSVVSNQFTALGTDRTNPLSFLAACVFILNLGVSKDLLLVGFRNMANTNPAALQKLLSNPAFQQVLRALQYLPSGKVMFASNQTTLDMRSPTLNFGISSQLIASLDDVAFNSNQSECAGFISLVQGSISFDIILLNTLLFGASLRSNDNRFLDGLTITIYSLLSYGFMNTATGNQASHCMITLGNLRAINSNIILIDDLCKDQKQMISTAMAVPAGKDF